MRTFLLFFLMPLTSLASEMKIFSMNLHCGLGDWKQRMDIVVAEIIKVNPDVIGLQEVCYNDDVNMTDYIRGGLEKGGYPVKSLKTIDTHRSFMKYQEQLLLISKYPVAEMKSGHLPSVPFLRNSYVAFRIDNLWYLTTHLHFAMASVRKSQYSKIASLFAKSPVVIFGDLNSNPEDSETNVLKKDGWVPAFDGPTYPSEAPEKTLDGFWMSRMFYDEVMATTMERHFVNSRSQPSDHLGVSLNVLFR